MYRKFLFLTAEAFRTIRRHKGVTAISVIIMSLSLLMLAVFLLATDNVLRYVGEAQRDMKLYVYLEDDVRNRGVERLHNGVMAMDEVAQIVFISRDEALADFRLQLGDDADLLDALETNPLPNSFWVTPQEQHKNKTSMAYLAGKIIQLEGVEDVRYGKDFLERFTAIIKGIYYVDIIVGLIVIISAIFIISNAVRLTVISRKRNIKILKLVGATNRFITMPFIIEGALQGGIAAFVSLVLVFGVTIAARQVVPDLQYFSLQKATIYMFVCVAIGSIGSFAALRRYLKV
jgi:cell division transport system permease protein